MGKYKNKEYQIYKDKEWYEVNDTKVFKRNSISLDFVNYSIYRLIYKSLYTE